MKEQGGSVQRDPVIATLGTPKVIATLGTSTGLPHGPMLFRLSRARPARAPRGNPCRELPRPPVRTYPALSALPGTPAFGQPWTCVCLHLPARNGTSNMLL